jgi:hypothetical protein
MLLIKGLQPPARLYPLDNRQHIGREAGRVGLVGGDAAKLSLLEDSGHGVSRDTLMSGWRMLQHGRIPLRDTLQSNAIHCCAFTSRTIIRLREPLEGARCATDWWATQLAQIVFTAGAMRQCQSKFCLAVP